MEIRQVCIIGAGTMGTGIAQAVAQAGIRAHLLDTSQEAMYRSQKLLDRSLRRAVETGKLTPQDARRVRDLISWDPTWQVLADADWVIEAVSEDLGVKRGVLRQIASSVRPETPVSTNTLALPIDELAEAYGRPDRFLGVHFFNPAPAMKLVLIDPGSQTAPEVVEAARALCEHLGKQSMTSMEVPRHVVNRVFGAAITAAVDLLEEGAEPEAIDGAVEMGMGHAMGPLRTADLMGLDVVLSMLRSLLERTGQQRYRPPELIVQMVREGKLGRKSGEGFYSYEREE